MEQVEGKAYTLGVRWEFVEGIGVKGIGVRALFLVFCFSRAR